MQMEVEKAYRAETTSASVSCTALVQYSKSLLDSPVPTLPNPAIASLMKGPTKSKRKK